MIEFKIEYMEKHCAMNIAVTYGNFNTYDTVCSAFVSEDITLQLCKFIETTLNAIISNRCVEFDENKNPIYKPSFEERLIEKIKETE